MAKGEHEGAAREQGGAIRKQGRAAREHKGAKEEHIDEMGVSRKAKWRPLSQPTITR